MQHSRTLNQLKHSFRGPLLAIYVRRRSWPCSRTRMLKHNWKCQHWLQVPWITSDEPTRLLCNEQSSPASEILGPKEPSLPSHPLQVKHSFQLCWLWMRTLFMPTEPSDQDSTSSSSKKLWEHRRFARWPGREPPEQGGLKRLRGVTILYCLNMWFLNWMIFKWPILDSSENSEAALGCDRRWYSSITKKE